MTGKFIVLEGIDTGILSDQAEQLARWLRTEGINVVTTREPTDGPLGSQLRVLLNGRMQMHEYAKSLLFVADRLDHYDGPFSIDQTDYEDNGNGSKQKSPYGIKYDLEANRFVVCIHHLLSAYSQYNPQVSLDWLIKVNMLSTWPDLVIFMDVPIEMALTRVIKESGYDEEQVKLETEKLTILRHNYLTAIATIQESGYPVSIVESNSMTVLHRQCTRLLAEQFGMD